MGGGGLVMEAGIKSPDISVMKRQATHCLLEFARGRNPNASTRVILTDPSNPIGSAAIRSLVNFLPEAGASENRDLSRLV